MALPAFPALPPKLPITTEAVFYTDIVQYEGRVSQRTSTAPGRRRFSFRYEKITTAQKDAQVNFFKTVRGPFRRFNWVNPETGATHTVRFEMDEMRHRQVFHELWNIEEVVLLEVA